MRSSKSALSQYTQVRAETQPDNLNSYDVVRMLFNRSLERLTAAQLCIKKNDIAGRGENLGMVISILGALSASLDREAGKDISENLSKLYQYMMDKLVEANLKSSMELIEEVRQLLITIKSGWDGIEDQIKR